MITDGMKNMVLDLMKDESAEIEIFRSVEETGRGGQKILGTPTREFGPSTGKTIVITVGGGANNVRIDKVVTPDDQRFMDEHKIS